MWCKGEKKECSTQWERWNHSWTNALPVLLHHRSKPQWESLGSAFGKYPLALGFGSVVALAHSQLQNLECTKRPLQRSVWHRSKGIFQDKNREKNLISSGFTTGTFTLPTHRSAVCAWPQPFNSLNRLYESLKPWNFNYAVSPGHQTFSFTSIRESQKKEACT